MSEPMTDLTEMLANLDVTIQAGEYVFATFTDPPRVDAAAVIAEQEGTTLVLTTEQAAELGVPTTPSFRWLTLTIHSSLEAVGLTAAFSTALAEAGISCNVLAGYHHDHLLVPSSDTDRAVQVLRSLQRGCPARGHLTFGSAPAG